MLKHTRVNLENSSLYTLSFLLALLPTLVIAAALRLLAILPSHPFRPPTPRKRPTASRIVIILGSGGHTHEMLHLLRDLDTRKWTHRTYIVSSGDAFSAQRAADFEDELERRTKEVEKREQRATAAAGETAKRGNKQREDAAAEKEKRSSGLPFCVGPEYYNIHQLPRARRVHQSLLTTPFTALHTFLTSFAPLLASPPLEPNHAPQTPYEVAARDLPALILANGPATAVLVIYATLVLRFFNWRGAQSRGLCRTVYVESFARVQTLSLSARLVRGVVDRFLVQWEGLGERWGEFCGVLV